MEERRFSPARSLLWLGLAITLIGVLTYFLQHTPTMRHPPTPSFICR